MPRLELWARFIRRTDEAALSPDLSRAFRATIAFMVPLLLAARGWISTDVSFVALAAQNIAMVDIRGDYRLRFAMVVAMAAVFVGAAALGATVAGHLGAAVLAMGVMALAGGLWRHLSGDYGPSLAISSTLVFLIAANAPASAAHVASHAYAALCGGLWGVLVQVANWPLRPQHPLRRAVAESWEAIGDLFQSLAPGDAPTRHARILTAEGNLRAALDKTYAALAAARPGVVRQRLEKLNLEGARLATRLVAFNAALETVMAETDFASVAPALEPVLVSLTNLSRGAAVTVVSRQPAQLAMFEVRLRRLGSLLRVLRQRLAAAATTSDSARGQLDEIVRQIEALLPVIHDALRATVDRAEERAAFSLELLDLREHALRPLASALNLSANVAPALVRYTLRLALLTMVGIVVCKYLELPHGYWLPFTVVVVLQPDYGSTRQRAGQRLLGTFAGSAVASLLLWLHPPLSVLMAAAAGTMFAFGYLLKKNYAFAMFFVTLFIVLLTESTGPVTIAFTLERLGVTFAGGALALLAAHVFWPVWERDRLPPILAEAFQSTAVYLRLMLERAQSGGNFDAPAIAAKRRAEAATAAAFSSLQRLGGDPQNQREGLEHAALLANGNQRVIRALAVLSVHLTPSRAPLPAPLDRFATDAQTAFEVLGRAATGLIPARGEIETLLAALGTDFPEVRDAQDAWIVGQFKHIATELSALLVAVQDAAPAVTGERSARAPIT